jgi:hypothetical protein
MDDWGATIHNFQRVMYAFGLCGGVVPYGRLAVGLTMRNAVILKSCVEHVGVALSHTILYPKNVVAKISDGCNDSQSATTLQIAAGIHNGCNESQQR